MVKGLKERHDDDDVNMVDNFTIGNGYHKVNIKLHIAAILLKLLLFSKEKKIKNWTRFFII